MKMLVVFEKMGAHRFLGHLDLQRAMQRALRRSGLPVTYSQGFNPHLQLSFAAPLSVGIQDERRSWRCRCQRRSARRTSWQIKRHPAPKHDQRPFCRGRLPHHGGMAAATMCWPDEHFQQLTAVPLFNRSASLMKRGKPASGEDLRPLVYRWWQRRHPGDGAATSSKAQRGQFAVRTSL